EHLEHSHQVKIIEHSLERCTTLSERLDRTVVLHGSATSKRLLEEENIEEGNNFCALTNDNEGNRMSTLL
ncbi:NAD-binding protein, partial [Halomonas sp. ALS9]|uniref:NAD-binding protein n=1 Tax=Halomonas sp. ALS9 TaxID=1805819 RepID=UPI000AAC8BC0